MKPDPSLPSVLKVAFFEYKIEVDGQEAWEWNHAGRTHYRSRRITLHDRLPPTEQPVTLLHEILHALGEAYEISYWTDHEEKDGKQIDKIDMMAKALLLLIRENPQIVEYLRST
jgi:hypothetical protein